MKKVCYVLGAGFSAYADLPVMSNFIDKAKDIYFSSVTDESKNEIKKTLDSIKEFAIIKEYMNCDLSNIEELLSIADMKAYTSKKYNRNIKDFIRNVIVHYENSLFEDAVISDNSGSFFIPGHTTLSHYIIFICSLFNLSVEIQNVIYGDYERTKRTMKINNRDDIQYGVISFNYDTILERIIKIINSRCENGYLSLKRKEGELGSRYCKLHGSIDNDTIIPPTWAKVLKPEIKQDWSDAHEILKKANEIRIIGFSFPNTDSHISYLFKSALIENENLKSIDVLCLDSHKLIKDKYHSIFCTPKLRFVDNRVEEYFRSINYSEGENEVIYNGLETAHKRFFIENA
jgi:hypothetical protein